MKKPIDDWIADSHITIILSLTMPLKNGEDGENKILYVVKFKICSIDILEFKYDQPTCPAQLERSRF